MNREPKSRGAGGLRPLPAARVALLLALLAGPAHADPAEDRAARTLERFVSGWIERHPEQRSRLGDHSRDGALPLLSSTARARDAAWYRAQGESLAALPIEALSPARRVDVRLALGRAASEAAVLAGERLPERDPGHALERLQVALSVPIRGFHASPCSRATALRSRLRAVPEYLRDARISVAASDRASIEHALERVAALLELCRIELPRALSGCREARVQADLAQADSLATRALTEYEEHLRDHLLPGAGDGLALGRDAFAARLGEVAGSPVALDSLLHRARAEWTRRDAAGESAGTAAGAPRLGLDSAAVVSAEVRARLVAAGEYPKDLEERLELRDRPRPRGEAPLVTLGAWDPRGGRARLDLGRRPEVHAAVGEGVLAADPLFSRASSELALAREGTPGRATFAAVESRGVSRVRQALGYDAVRDGWGRYAETVWLRSCTGATCDEAARLHDRLERERLARAVAELMLRAESASVEDAARWLERGASLSPAAARRAAVEAAAAPRWAASTLAQWRLAELRDDAERAVPGAFDAAGFHLALLREGAVPTAWIAEPVRGAIAASRGRRR